MTPISLTRSIQLAKENQRWLLEALKAKDLAAIAHHRSERDGWMDRARRIYIRERRFA